MVEVLCVDRNILTNHRTRKAVEFRRPSQHVT
jgi:hypothetical protein